MGDPLPSPVAETQPSREWVPLVRFEVWFDRASLGSGGSTVSQRQAGGAVMRHGSGLTQVCAVVFGRQAVRRLAAGRAHRRVAHFGGT
jgi:hypothetical protein